MSRGIVVGVSWTDPQTKERIERVAAGPDAKIRQVLDKVVAVVPDHIRPAAARFFAPLLEKNEPAKAGMYPHNGVCAYVIWWKRAYIEET